MTKQKRTSFTGYPSAVIREPGLTGDLLISVYINAIKWGWIGFVLFSGLMVSKSFSLEKDREHPVKVTSAQLEKPKSCLGCHKTIEGKFIHSALSSGNCAGCHEAKTKDEKTIISLTNTGNELCLMCHDNKRTTSAKSRIHSPVAEGECTACHNPHSSANKFQLVQPLSGVKNENLCLLCHDIGVETPQKGSRHAALDMGCDSCHVTHKTGPPEKQEFAYHLAQSIPALCLNCHDTANKQLMAAHRGQPVSESNCVSCHDPHGSEDPKLLHKFSHPPFAERQCDSCHETTKDNRVVVMEKGKRSLCAMCHEEVEKKVLSSKAPHGVFAQSDTCTVCHSPHTSPFPQHLNLEPNSLCATCHKAWVEERSKKVFKHAPVFKGGCTICHEPHGSNFSKHLRADINDLCLTCHARDAQGEAGSDANTLILFSGTVKLPGNYLNQLKHIPVQRGGNKGHPQLNHPVGDMTDATNSQRKISCVSCHDPHAGNGNIRMFVTGTKSSSPLCVRCHK